MIEIKNLSKSFASPAGEVKALENVDLTVNDGEIFGIIGMSGAGKSTLVRCINLLERPTQGQILLDGEDVALLPPKALREKRREVSMIFQSFNLLQQRTCLKNVCLPMELTGTPKKEAKERAMALLTRVGLPDKAKNYPSQLSGGQQQRVAIARALASSPKVLLCDEATSALDPKTTGQILRLIREINRELNLTVIVITHQMSVVEDICDRVAILDKGTVAEVGKVAEVFSRPQSRAARRLVFPEGYEHAAAQIPDGCIRLVFGGVEAAAKPLIATMAIERGIVASILNASTKTIEGRTYGSMLLSVPGGKKEVERALAYISEFPDLTAEEVARRAE